MTRQEMDKQEIGSIIVEYSRTEAALADLRTRYAATIFDVTTGAGMASAIKARAEIRGYRVALETMRVDIKAPALERCRLIDAEAKRITAEIVALEAPIDRTIKAEEARKAAEKAAKEQAERERIAQIQQAIEAIRRTALVVVGKPSSTIRSARDKVAATEVGSSFAEFSNATIVAINETVTTLDDILAKQIEAEAQAEAVAAERLALAKQRAEQEAAAIAERKRIAEEADAAKIISDKIAAEARAQEDARRAAENAAAAAKMAEDRAELAKQQAIVAEQQKEVARQRAEAVAAANKEHEEAEARRLAAIASDPVSALREIVAIAGDAEIYDATARDMILSIADAALAQIATSPA